jgi:hypothetical protein
MNRKARRAVAAERGRPDDDDGSVAVSFDHVWPGGEGKLRRRYPTGERAAKAEAALLEVGIEITEGRGKCSECSNTLRGMDDMGACTIVDVCEAGLTIGIPFCRRCAASPKIVSQLAKQALARMVKQALARIALDEPRGRLQ